MNKQEFVKKYADIRDVSVREATEDVNAVLTLIEDTVASGDKVKFSGFGNFEPRVRQARDGRNPQTGAALKIKAGVTAGFKPGAIFKRKVSEGKAKKLLKK